MGELSASRVSQVVVSSQELTSQQGEFLGYLAVVPRSGRCEDPIVDLREAPKLLGN